MQLIEGLFGEIDRESYEPKTLIIDLIRQCTETCKHCVVAASPSRREKLQLEKVRLACEDAANNGFLSVSFYGGEPFTAKQLLYDSIGCAYQHGLQPQIMTNGFWGKSAEMARKTFDQLAQVQSEIKDSLNIDPISIQLSTDEFHEKVPLEHLAGIFSEWVRRPEAFGVNLAIGTLDADDENIHKSLTAILDAFDEQNEQDGVKSCIHEDPIYGGYTIRFVDKDIQISTNATVDEVLGHLENEEMLSETELQLLCESDFAEVMHMFLHIKMNGMLQLVQTKEQKGQGVCQIGRMMPDKVAQFRTYTINLFGAGRDLLKDETLRQRASDSRSKANREVNIHEHRAIMMLGADNQFYVAPIQLQHQINPIGCNTGDGIRDAIQQVNSGDVVSNILINQDLAAAKMYALNAGDYAAYERMNELDADGLTNEALEEFLLSQKTLESLPKPPLPLFMKLT